MEHSTQYKECFVLAWVNISDVWKRVALLAVKSLRVYNYLLMQSMVLQIIGSNYHAHLTYFGITNRVCFVFKKIVQDSSFQVCIRFYNRTLTF